MGMLTFLFGGKSSTPQSFVPATNRLPDLPCRTDPDAINVPYGAKTQCWKILTWLSAGQELSSMMLIVQLRASSAASRGREVRKWLRNHGFNVVKRTVKQDSGARVLFWKLAPADRPRLRALLNQSKGS